jgi:predicted AAA+ superfamily ATPase
MPYIPRRLEAPLRRAANDFAALLVTGPRRAGKTELLRHAFPRAAYVLLEDPEVLLRLRSDPRAFVESLRPPVILDEVQNAPEIFAYVRTRIDLGPRRGGQWLLSGSQEAPLMRGVTESMAGRVATFDLLPFSTEESGKVGWFRGGFPEVVLRPRSADVWFRSYVRTYLERDVRQVTAIRDLSIFRRFLALVASRCGRALNRTDLAAPLGVSVPTVSQWLSILEVTGQILLVPPHFENFGKRLTRSPKLYFVDAGLLCHLLGIASEEELIRSPFAGPVFEGFVASEVVKAQGNAGMPRALHCFRDREGLEVDFVVPRGGGRLALVEAKASRTVSPADAASLSRLREAAARPGVQGFVVHRTAASDVAGAALLPGIRAVGVADLVRALVAQDDG